MEVDRRSGLGWSRRAFLGSCYLARLTAASRKGTVYPSEISRYVDPATEFVVTRLTDPAHSSYVPRFYCRFLSRKRNFMIYASDRTGSLQMFQMDLQTGENRQLTEAAELDPASLALFPDDRHVAFFDGRVLYRETLNNRHAQPLYTVPEGSKRGHGFSLSADGRYASFVECAGRRWRVRLLDIRRKKAATVVESGQALRDPIPRPGHRSILYRDAEANLWIAEYNGKGKRRLTTAPGTVGPATWSPNARAVIYLNIPPERSKLNNLREYFVDTRQDRLIANTSQFVSFGPNGDASVFVGASGGRATPLILLLVRNGGSELTLCEHRASDPSRVAPVFSPDSRRIVFQSDRDGKPALYSMEVDDLVEATDPHRES